MSGTKPNNTIQEENSLELESSISEVRIGKLEPGKTYSQEDLKSFYANSPFSIDMDTIMAMSKKNLKNAFETASVEGNLTIALPCNIDTLAKDPVFQALLFCITEAKMKAVILNDRYEFKTVLNDKQKAAFHAFAMNIIKNVITPCPKQKSNIQKALISSVHYMMGGEGVDTSLFKKSPSILDLCFASKTAKVKPIERKVIDMLISYARNKNLSGMDFSSYLKSPEEIKKERGLSITINDKIWTTSELEFIRLYFKGKKMSKELKLDMSKVKYLSDIRDLQNTIRRWQTKASQVKKLLKSIVNSRMRDIYPRGKGGKIDKQFKSKKIEDVIALAKGSDRYLSMNPSKILVLVGMPEFISEVDKDGQYWLDYKNFDSYILGLKEIVKEIHPQLAGGYLTSLENDYKLFLKNLNLT